MKEINHYFTQRDFLRWFTSLRNQIREAKTLAELRTCKGQLTRLRNLKDRCRNPSFVIVQARMTEELLLRKREEVKWREKISWK